ncbi:MAG: hypothetical protein ACRC5M_06680 [Anaeroplasmataceae bacterium]
MFYHTAKYRRKEDGKMIEGMRWYGSINASVISSFCGEENVQILRDDKGFIYAVVFDKTFNIGDYILLDDGEWIMIDKNSDEIEKYELVENEYEI